MTLTWIVAYKCSEFQMWQEYLAADELQMAQEAAELCAADQARQLVCIFYNKPGWEKRRPRYVIADRREKANWPINGLGGLINSLSSDYFGA